MSHPRPQSECAPAWPEPDRQLVQHLGVAWWAIAADLSATKQGEVGMAGMSVAESRITRHIVRPVTHSQ